eukprot:c5664_g1_i1.p1 GENE.c5664_g1_i1~~c5664_g1_i1.p1  ORF type:complete len:131 (+),score=26.87 c5664_g1_i1:29-421(+)
MKVIRTTPHSFHQVLLDFSRENQPVFLLVCGEIDAETGVTWCSDCAKADPIIHENLDKIKGYLLQINVSRADWKNQSSPHPLRTDKLRITAVPTLVFFSDGHEVARLVEEECYDLDKVSSFMEAVNDEIF